MWRCCWASRQTSGRTPTRWPRFVCFVVLWPYLTHRSDSTLLFLPNIQIPFFDDVGAVTLQYFDSLFQRDNLQKSQFYKGLPKVLPKLPKVKGFFYKICKASFRFFSLILLLCHQRVVVYRILPALTSEFVNPDMVPFVLPNVLLIAEDCTKDEYVRLIMPDLTPVFKLQEPVQVSVFVQGALHVPASTTPLLCAFVWAAELIDFFFLRWWKM